MLYRRKKYYKKYIIIHNSDYGSLTGDPSGSPVKDPFGTSIDSLTGVPSDTPVRVP